MTVNTGHKVPQKRSLPKAPAEARLNQEKSAPGDSVSLGSTAEPSLEKPNFEKAAAPSPVVITDHPKGKGIGGMAKVVAFGMAGMALLSACTPGGQTGGTGSSTVDSEAMQQLNKSLDGIKASIDKDGSQSQEQVAGKVFSSIADYSRATGEKGEELMNNLAGTIRKHPVLAASIAFAAGNAIGIGADQLGITDQIGETAADAANWVKEHPFKAAAIGVAVAGAGYLLYNYAIKPMAEVPPKPTGEHAEAMEKTFAEIEAQLKANEGGDSKKAAQEASLTLGQKIKEYAAATGRSAKEVGQDVHAWAYEHPVVATSLVMAGGVATGTLLSKAGVPETVAQYAGVAIDAAGNGFQKVGEFAKEHPVVAGAVVAGVAAGAGYLIYTNMGGGADAPAPAGG